MFISANEYACNIELIAKILYVWIVVTKVAIDCLIIISTHLIELECLDVNGAAIHASPTLI